MAVRNIRKESDKVLRKISKDVEKIDDRTLVLIEDMVETMYKSDGVGLAAPQVGILKRIIVLDDGTELLKLINPVIKEQSGEQMEIEGCLSVPGVYGEVKRPLKVKVDAVNTDGEKVEIEAEGLRAIILSHEIDHLDGILFIDKAERILTEKEIDEKRKSKNKDETNNE
ncbi:MAG TPA: peptide deformylase [Clostridiaceae bacterium]|jgi:peptide deformylase|nr:peptide deformylase [Clostridiaceae bacterium]